MFKYEFRGGVDKPSLENSIKFLLFFVVGGQEVPHYQMIQNGQVREDEGITDPTTGHTFRVSLPSPTYRTNHNIVKIFVRSSGADLPNRFYSFYLKLGAKRVQEVTIKPFPGCQGSGYYFKSRGNFLTKNQALGLLSEDCPSRIYLKRQELPSKETLRAMIKIDRSVQMQGIRHIRIGQRKGGGG